MRLRPTLALTTAAAVFVSLAACSGGTTPNDSPTGGEKTFVLAVSADLGSLDPSLGLSSPLFWASRFAYDTLITLDLAGELHSALASDWRQQDDQLVFTIKDGVTCSDGAAFTAQTAAANINFVADAANASPLLGTILPVGATATAEGQTLTVTLGEPAPFALTAISDLTMVCDAGLADRSKLQAGTIGSGPYELTEAVPGDHYSYKIRSGYTWGPDGAATDGSKMPTTVVIKVVENETTLANMLLAKEVNAGLVTGADTDRLIAAGLFALEANMVLGEQWANEAQGHPTADPAVRQALIQAVDLAAIRAALTSGLGAAPTTFATSDPVACPGDSISANLPASADPAGAGATLEAAGWSLGADGVRAQGDTRLAITFAYDSGIGPGVTAAAELATAAWQDAGFEVDARQLPTTQMEELLFGTGAWDVAWEPVNISSPDQLVTLVSGVGVAEGGMNFAGIQNSAYEAKVADAAQQVGQTGCPTWLEAEAELVKAADVVPFANSVIKVFGAGATFERGSVIFPTSIVVE
ncbi:MAG: ABC transporter substrate-binding protein [Bifidobacteriaceae bacterium]|jgi:peptide/nickel transport system substrate-binding protein|nr:ABC transporter substrate-binding protein [Bifidobacteriaceae bacterium]